MNFLEQYHQEFFSPWVKSYQVKRSLDNSKIYNNKSSSGKIRSQTEMFMSVIHGEAIEHHYLNLWSMFYKCYYSDKPYFDLCCNENYIEFKTFKDINNVVWIVDHLCTIPSRLSNYIMFFERKGSWNNNLQYRIACVYSTYLKEFSVIGEQYKKLDHILFYIESNLSRKCK